MMRVTISITSLLAGLGLTACHAAPQKPAVLVDTSPNTRAAVSADLAAAMGRAQVEIGPADLEGASTVSVLPPPLSPLETASRAMPTHFDLMMEGDACYAVRRETGETVMLDGVTCVAQTE